MFENLDINGLGGPRRRLWKRLTAIGKFRRNHYRGCTRRHDKSQNRRRESRPPDGSEKLIEKRARRPRLRLTETDRSKDIRLQIRRRSWQLLAPERIQHII